MKISTKGWETVNKKRIAAGIMALAMLFFVLFTVSFIAHEADHDCSGDDCPVCALIQMCEEGLRQLGTGLTAAAAATAPLAVLILILPVCDHGDVIFSTPVSRKTRLNN